MPEGICCPRCGCFDLRETDGKPWKVTRTVHIPYAVRRYKICRNCGAHVRTKETIERTTDGKDSFTTP